MLKTIRDLLIYAAIMASIGVIISVTLADLRALAPAQPHHISAPCGARTTSAQPRLVRASRAA